MCVIHRYYYSDQFKEHEVEETRMWQMRIKF